MGARDASPRYVSSLLFEILLTTAFLGSINSTRDGIGRPRRTQTMGAWDASPRYVSSLFFQILLTTAFLGSINSTRDGIGRPRWTQTMGAWDASPAPGMSLFLTFYLFLGWHELSFIIRHDTYSRLGLDRPLRATTTHKRLPTRPMTPCLHQWLCV